MYHIYIQLALEALYPGEDYYDWERGPFLEANLLDIAHHIAVRLGR